LKHKFLFEVERHVLASDRKKSQRQSSFWLARDVECLRWLPGSCLLGGPNLSLFIFERCGVVWVFKANTDN